MNRKDSDKPNGWDFEVDGGKQYILRKPQWPDVLRLRIPRWYAFDMIESLLSQLRDDEDTVYYAFCGNLEEDHN